MKKTLLIISFLFLGLNIFSQNLFYQDVFYGGVTGGGFSSGSNNGTASGQIIVNIDPTSTIKKAYLFCNRYESTQPLNIVLNSIVYTFNLSNQIGNNYFISSPASIDSCAIHAIDITRDINPSQNSYNISYPPQLNAGGNFNKYGAFYLLVLYENNSLQKTAVSVILNGKDMRTNVNYQINNLLPIDITNPVGLAIHSDIIWDTIQDGSYVNVNGNNIGLIGGSDAINSPFIGGGVKGDFYYQNNTLFGLDDDTPDSLMLGSDGLADIKTYINNGDNSFDINLIKQPTAPYNVYLAFFLTYTTLCDTFTTTITANDTICLGESIQLNATGGVQYSWFGAFGGLSDTSIANPLVSPPQTTTYICTIKNDSGCVKTEQVKIWVNPLPVADTLIVTNNFCGDSVGSLQVGTISNGGQPYLYSLTNLQTGNTQNSSLNTFNSLGTANHQLTITDINGCTFTDTATITETNIVQANFTATPSSGVAPLNVDFSNTSVNANVFEWMITSLPFGSAQGVLDTLVWIPACAGNAAACGLQYEFINSGIYQACLIAYNNIPTCADTICKTIIVTDEISFVIPNVFTPNFDNENDNFVIQVSGASLIKTLKVEVFNRWGMLVANREFTPFGSAQGANSQNTLPTTQYTIWDGRTTAAEIAPDGTYFYVISYIKGDASATLSTRKGSITLLR